MTVTDYCYTIQAPISAEEAADRIGRVSEWWVADVTGRATEVGDRFTVRFGEAFVDFEISEAVLGERYVWRVTDCFLPWLTDKNEWTGTSVIWEVSESEGDTTVEITHEGLHPGVECYADCRKGWDFYVGKSLLQFLTTGKGLPDRQHADAVAA
jgi:hypothetical protein